MKRQHPAILIALLLTILLPATAQMNAEEEAHRREFQKRVPGTYQAVGWNPGVPRTGPPSYQAVLELKGAEHGIFAKWTAKGQSYTGTGMVTVILLPNQAPVYLLSIGYKASPQSTNVITYRLMGDPDGGPLVFEGSWPDAQSWGFERATANK